MAKRAPKPYAVGYKKPPHATQFKPGQSGNRAGRPKGSKNLASVILKELSKHITVTEQGKQRSMPKSQVMATQLVNKALQDPKLMALVMKMIGPVDEEAGSTPVSNIFNKPEDELVMESIVRRIRLMDDPPTASFASSPEPGPGPVSNHEEVQK